MLNALLKLIDNVKQLDAGKVFVKVIFQDEVRLFIIDLNKQKQLFELGVGTNGEVLGYYSAYTEELTGGAKKAGDHYTLYDTGAFYRSFDVNVYADNSFEIEADTIKEDGTDLQRKFLDKGAITGTTVDKKGEITGFTRAAGSGGNILGLTTESKNKLVEKILPDIRNEILRRLQTF